MAAAMFMGTRAQHIAGPRAVGSHRAHGTEKLTSWRIGTGSTTRSPMKEHACDCSRPLRIQGPSDFSVTSTSNRDGDVQSWVQVVAQWRGGSPNKSESPGE